MAARVAALTGRTKRPMSTNGMLPDEQYDDVGFDAEAWLRSFAVDTHHASEPTEAYGTRKNPVVEETFRLADRVMDYSEVLEQRNHTFADQILRSGTAVGSHTREAQGAESLADFIHKMKIAYKELEETDYRLDLCHRKAHDPHDLLLVAMTKRLFPLFNAILSTSRERLRQRKEK